MGEVWVCNRITTQWLLISINGCHPTRSVVFNNIYLLLWLWLQKYICCHIFCQNVDTWLSCPQQCFNNKYIVIAYCVKTLKVQICGPTRTRWRLWGYLWETQLTAGHVLWQVTFALDGNSCECFNEHGFGLMLPKFGSMLGLFCWHLVM
jgi:hypothetical protein